MCKYAQNVPKNAQIRENYGKTKFKRCSNLQEKENVKQEDPKISLETFHCQIQNGRKWPFLILRKNKFIQQRFCCCACMASVHDDDNGGLQQPGNRQQENYGM